MTRLIQDDEVLGWERFEGITASFRRLAIDEMARRRRRCRGCCRFKAHRVMPEIPAASRQERAKSFD